MHSIFGVIFFFFKLNNFHKVHYLIEIINYFSLNSTVKIRFYVKITVKIRSTIHCNLSETQLFLDLEDDV